ncbi:MAG: hypothetical protein ABSG25_12935, partial [Bryobacteraceae bacterium]
AGFWREMCVFWRTVRASYAKQPAAAILCGLAAAALLSAIAVRTGTVYLKTLPAFVETHKQELKASVPAYAWMRSHLPENASVLAYDDPLVYLYAGRQARRMVVSPEMAIQEDREPVRRLFAGVAGFARSRNLQYVFETPWDWSGEFPAPERREARRIVDSNPDLRNVYQLGGVSVLRVD